MPARFHLELPIDAPPTRVFAGLRDVDSARLWMPDGVRFERLVGQGALAAGDEWREIRRTYGREASEVFEVIAVEAPQRLELRVDGKRGATGKGEFRFVYRLEPRGEATVLHFEGSLAMPGPLSRLFARLMVGSFRRACARDLRAFAAWVEGGG